MGDNHHYIKCEDFDTVDDANSFLKRLNTQYEMSQNFNLNKITYKEYLEWEKTVEIIEIENGFIESTGKIVGFYPEKEVEI